MPVLADPFPTFQPAMRIVDNITNAFPALVSTTFDHQYESGLIVRLNVPLGFGMVQADQQVGSIIVVSPTTFLIDIDTTHFDVFEIPVAYPYDAQFATVVPIGEDNSTVYQATRNILPYAAP